MNLHNTWLSKLGGRADFVSSNNNLDLKSGALKISKLCFGIAGRDIGNESLSLTRHHKKESSEI